MRPLVLVLALLAPLPALAEPSQPPPIRPRARVLVTGFDPFAGRPTNNSWTIANELPNVIGDDIEIVLCRLPVVYDEGAKAAQKCLDEMDPKPDLVISMGEAGCSVRLETAAHNLDDSPGFPDNAGNIHDRKTIIEGAPKSLGFDLPVQEMYCSLPPELRSGVDVSETPGGFVCNNTSYHLAHALQGTGTRFSFVHVPNSGCSDEAKDPAKNARTIATMIQAVFDSDDRVARESDVLPHCSNDIRLPYDKAEAERILEIIRESGDRDCEREFVERLKERL